MGKALKIAFVHQIDPAAGISSWVGTLHFLKQACSRHGGKVTDLGPAPLNPTPYRAVRKLVRIITGRNYSFHHDPAIGRRLAKHFNKALAQEKYDLIFAPGASAIVPFLRTDLPIICYSDATWRLVRDYYHDYINVIGRTAEGGEELERRMLERVSIMLYPSEWAASSAVRDYDADPSKIVVNFLGASLENPPERSEVLPRTIGRSIRLLLVGYSWELKGGTIAYETLLRLLELGFNAELTVIGCTPPEEIRHPKLKLVPPLDKRKPDDAALFDRLWREADFFILPSRCEAAGVVYAEASAYALPSLATSTGGVPSIVHDGVNGFTLPTEARGDQYAAIIADLAADPERYTQFCETSRNEFETRLNWDTWGIALAHAIRERLPHLR